jgi:ParB family chromosome partitioning protein
MPVNYGQESTGDLPRFRAEHLTLVTRPGHPLFDKRALLPPREDMVESILAIGLLEPILVRENGRLETGRRIIEIVAGRTRYIAMVEANRRLVAAGKPPLLVPCVMKREAGEGEVAMHMVIAENEIRQPDMPSHRADKAAAMKDAGASIDTIATAFGIAPEAAKQLIALAGLDQKSKAAIDAGTLPLRDAPKLRQIPEETRVAIVDEAKASPRAAKVARSKVAKEAKGRTAPSRTYVRNVRTKDEIETAIAEASELWGTGAGAKCIRALEWVLGQRETWH